MLSAGLVRGGSVGSMIEALRCRRADKRRHPAVDDPKANFNLKDKLQFYESELSKPRHRLPLALTLTLKCGDERKIRAKHGLLER